MRNPGPTGTTVPLWVPEGFRRSDVLMLHYVVVDELESDRVGLCISPWPVVDERGRLRFDLDATWRAGVRESDLLAHLERHRTPKRPTQRPLRIGDVFAVRIRGRRPRDGVTSDPRRWMGPPIVDLSRKAREVAKLSFHAAVAPLLHPKRDRAVINLATEGVTLQGRKPRRAPKRQSEA